MKTINLRSLIGALFLTVLVCAGFWIYTEIDLKHFKETLSNGHSLPTVPGDTPAVQEVDFRGADRAKNVRVVPHTTPDDTEKQHSEPASSMPESAFAEENAADDISLENFFEEHITNSIDSGDFIDDMMELPYDLAAVKAGFDDYNEYLRTDPERAYRRLDDAFREQYGDDPDVDILVEHIRASNEGPTTIGEAIVFVEAMIRLTSKMNLPEASGSLPSLQLHLELLRETQQLALEEGATEVLHQDVMHIGE